MLKNCFMPRERPRPMGFLLVLSSLVILGSFWQPNRVFAQVEPEVNTVEPEVNAVQPENKTSPPAGQGAPSGAPPETLEIYRTGALNFQNPERKNLIPNPWKKMNWEIWKVSGVNKLFIHSKGKDGIVLFRFESHPTIKDGLTLTVVLISRRQTRDYLYLEKSSRLSGGLSLPHRIKEIGEEVLTELEGIEGRVVLIRVEDDGAAEVRIQQKGDAMALLLVTPAEGGDPSERGRLEYHGENLRFMDYRLMGGGYKKSLFLEAVILKNLALTYNQVKGTDFDATALRLAIRAEVARGRRLSLWLEGGGGIYTGDPTDTASGEATWHFGMTGHYRRGNWGGMLHLASIDGPTVAMISGGWQVFKRFGGMIYYESVGGISGTGLGLTYDF